MMGWLALKAFGLPRWLWVVLGVVAIVALWIIVWTRMENADDERNQEIGATVEREKSLEKTVERVKEANDVREEINRNDDAGAELRYRQCLRSARTPTNCERFLPQRPAD
jgi:FtsZ-interacting cell division protein ZipA